MKSVAHAVKTKGVMKTIQRVGSIAWRYGVTSKKMKKNISGYARLASDYGATPTFPVTATVLEKHAKFFRGIGEDAELAIHGFRHVNMAALPEHRQQEHVANARQVFEKNGVTPHGFRAPYLMWNDSLIRTLERSNLEYDSSVSYYWKGFVEETASIKRALDMYSPKKQTRPFKAGKIVRIPVSLPDDEMLVDRLGKKPDEVKRVWLNCFDAAMKNKSLFVLQLHPERFGILKDPLKALLERAQEKKVWRGPLHEAAKRKEGLVVTGDIDFMEIGDRI
ncbi:polysaccharide deacetylase family protein [archaeon]